nr:hypothetical protein [Oleiphilaceae bacterium]
HYLCLELAADYKAVAWEGMRQGFPKPCGAMDGGAERTGRDSQRVLENPAACAPSHYKKECE